MTTDHITITCSRLSRIFIILLLTITAASCSSNRQQASVPDAHPGKAPAMRVDRVQQIADTYTAWTSFYAPFSMKLEKPAKFSISGRATMEYGKNIHMSLRILGMEVGVVYIDSDSAYVADKFHRYLVAVPFSAISGRTGLTVADLQSLMLGRIFYPGKGCIGNVYNASDLFSPANEGSNLLLTPRRTPQGATWYYTVNDIDALTGLSVEAPDYGDINVTFSDVIQTVAGNAAARMDANGTVASKNISASSDWNLGRAQWNSSRTASRPDFSSYKRISTAALLKALKNL